MKKYIIIATTILVQNIVAAQQNDSIFKNQAEKKIKAEFSGARILNIDYNQTGSTDFESQLLGENFQKGTLKNQKQVTVGLNIPIYKSKKWTYTGSVNYKFNEFVFSDLQNISTSNMYQQDNALQFHTFSTALSATYFSSLFKKPFIYNASIIADGNNKGFERITGLIGGSFILKRTDRTLITLGAVFFVDPSAQIPFFPTFSYNYKFKNSNWDFDFILPQRLYFRRTINTSGRLSIGSSLNSTGFYANIDQPNFPKTFVYSQLEINSGLVYEHQINKSFVATFKGGVSSFINSRLTEKGTASKDYIYKNEQDAKGYFNVGISFNPSSKKKQKNNIK